MKKEKSRKTKKQNRFSGLSMKIFFTLFVICEFLLIDFIASLIVGLLEHYKLLVNPVPKLLWSLIISIPLGTTITSFLVKFFMDPMIKLGEAICKVSEGDFSATLKTKHLLPQIRQVNRNFNLMTQELNSTEILKTEFVSNVSHEFKTPITAIEGYAMLLQGTEQADDPEQAEYISKILFNTHRLSKLVGNILLLSKVDNQGILPTVTTYRLDEQIRQSIVSLEPKWTEKNNDFDVNLERIEYTGNESLLTHVWDNLIENAIKYGPEGGLISMKLTGKEGKVIFTIEDQGPGIPQESQKHIFDRFYQADSSRKTEGNGLGLALVRQILNKTDGSIQIENLPERGCRFTVTLNNG